jgi:branched-chain amino acid transport system permease protein
MTATLVWQSALAGLANSFIYAMVGIGIAVIFKGTRIVNAMQGDFAVIGGMLAVVALSSWGLPYPLAIICGVVGGAATGVVIDRLCVRPMMRRNAEDDAFLLLTIGLAYTISAAVLFFAGRDSHLLPGIGGDGVVEILGAFVTVHSIWLVVISLIMVTGLWAFYRFSIIGLSMTAVSIDADGAATNGIDVERMRGYTFVLGGAIGALAGILVTPMISVSYQLGLGLTLKGFAAAILGGLANPLGAVIGGLIIGLSESLAVVALSSGYKDVVALSIMIVMMVIMPNGILGRAGRRGG